MYFLLIKTIIQRFLEILLSCVIISAGVTTLNVTKLVTTNDALCLWLVIGIIVFVFINIELLRQRYFDWESNFLYFLINISAYILFAIVSIIIYFCSNEYFTWMFALAKFVQYSNAEIATHYSLLLFHILGLLAVIFAPVGMKWVFEDNEDAERDKYYESYDEE